MSSSLIQYPFAFDEQGFLVSVHDISKEHRYNHSYTCPECGKAMLPRLGEKRTKHFYHSEGQSCGVESYLHKVAKLILEIRFNKRDKPFIIKCNQKVLCAEHISCVRYNPVYCFYKTDYTEDLSTEYDLPAIIEPTITSTEHTFRPDICIRSSNPSKEDIFLEVWYKHRSSNKKIDSGKRIIEFHIKSEGDLLSLLTRECFAACDSIVFYNFDTTTPIQNMKETGWINNPSCPFLYGRDESFGRRMSTEYATVSRNNSLPRLCCYCMHHADYYDGAEWCVLDLDISTRKGTFENTRAEWCDSFRPKSHLETDKKDSEELK